MKKIILFLSVLCISAIAVIAQQPDTINVSVITGNASISEFLKHNMWVLIFILYSFLEVWFGQTNLIKEGSILALIWNWVGKFIGKQLPTAKGKFMEDEKIAKLKAERKAKQFRKSNKT